MVENRPVYCLVSWVTIALVNTSQVGKVLTHSINLVKPIESLSVKSAVLPLMKSAIISILPLTVSTGLPIRTHKKIPDKHLKGLST